MAIELNVKSDIITAMEGQNKTPVGKHGGRMRFASAVVTFTGTTTTSGSTYRAVRLPSGARVVYGSIRGIGATDVPNVDVGAWHASLAWIDDDSFTTALDVDDTGPHEFVGIGFTGASDPTKQMWEYTNATSDPGGDIDIMLSLDADIVAAGTARVVVHYVVD